MLQRYILREVASALPAALGLLVFVLLLLQAERLGPLVLTAAAAPGAVARLVLATLPLLFAATLPAALLISVLAGLGRMAEDGELVALVALGRGPRTLLPAPLLLGSIAALVAIGSALWLEPPCRRHLRSAAHELAGLAARAMLRPGEVVELVPEVTFFASEVAASGAGFSSVVVHDARADGDRWLAAAGVRVMPVAASVIPRLHLRFDRGELHERLADAGFRRASFRSYELTVDLSAATARRTNWLRDFEGLSPGALLAEARRIESSEGRLAAVPMRYLLWQKLAMGAACVAFVLLAFALGSSWTAAARWRAVALGVIVAAGYYAVARAGEAAAVAGSLPPWLGAMLPVLATLGATGALWTLDHRRLRRPVREGNRAGGTP